MFCLTATCHLLVRHASVRQASQPPATSSRQQSRTGFLLIAGPTHGQGHAEKKTRHTAHGTRGANDHTPCAAAHAPDLHVPISTWPSTWWKQSVRGTWAANARRQQGRQDGRIEVGVHGTFVTRCHRTRAWALARHSFLDLPGSFQESWTLWEASGKVQEGDVPGPRGERWQQSSKKAARKHNSAQQCSAPRHTADERPIESRKRRRANRGGTCQAIFANAGPAVAARRVSLVNMVHCAQRGS